MATENNNQAQIVQAEAPAATRAQAASAHRAFQDINASIQHAQEVLSNAMTFAPVMGYDAFQQAWQARQALNGYQEQANQLQQGLSSHIPAPSAFQAQLSDTERKQIRGLYASGLYTQQHLASQYGVSQATIARIVV